MGRLWDSAARDLTNGLRPWGFRLEFRKDYLDEDDKSRICCYGVALYYPFADGAETYPCVCGERVCDCRTEQCTCDGIANLDACVCPRVDCFWQGRWVPKTRFEHLEIPGKIVGARRRVFTTARDTAPFSARFQRRTHFFLFFGRDMGISDNK